jgi:hypothetical protein
MRIRGISGKQKLYFQGSTAMLMKSAPFWGSNAAGSSEFLILENGTDKFSRNVGKGLPLDTA